MPTTYNITFAMVCERNIYYSKKQWKLFINNALLPETRNNHTMKKFSLTFLILFFLQHFSYSQNKHIVDSLESQLKEHNAAKMEMQIKSPSLYDTTAVNILAALCMAHWGNDPTKAMDYAEQMLALSEQIGYKKGKASVYYSMGVSNRMKGEY